MQFIIIKPGELKERLEKIHKKQILYRVISGVTNHKRCWESRGVKKREQLLIKENKYTNDLRDFSDCLNAWHKIVNQMET